MTIKSGAEDKTPVFECIASDKFGDMYRITVKEK